MSRGMPPASAPSARAPAPSPLRPLLDDFRQKHAVPALGAALVSARRRAGRRRRRGTHPRRRRPGHARRPVAYRLVLQVGYGCPLYARLVERGDAEWGIPLPALFPDLADTTHPAWEAVTIDDVFVSQAGLPANLGRAEMKAAYRDARPLLEQRASATAAALRAGAPSAGPVPLLQPRLHRHRRRDRADHGRCRSSRPLATARPRAARDHLRPASGPRVSCGVMAGRMLALDPFGLVDLGAWRSCGSGAGRVGQSPDHDSGGTAAPHARRTGRGSSASSSPTGEASCAPRRSSDSSPPLPGGGIATRSAGRRSAATTTPHSASRDRTPTGSRRPSSTGRGSVPRWCCATRDGRGSFGTPPGSPSGSSRRTRGS